MSTHTSKIRAAQRRVRKAKAELEAAGEALLEAIGATAEERTGAADLLADIHHEADADGWAGAEWPNMLADMVLQIRADELDEED